MSSIVGGSMRRMPRAAERDLGANTQSARFGEDVIRGAEVLDCQAERLEERDLVGVAPRLDLPDENLADLADDVIGGDVAVLERDDDVCLLYTSDAADERSSVDLGGRRI